MYSPFTWVNEILDGTKALFTLKQSGSTIYDDVEIDLKTSVLQAGTLVNADRMNYIEDGIEANSAAFDASTGHDHDGTDSKKIAYANIIANDGWTLVSDTWTYASATTITVPSGAALLYAIGDKLRIKQGGGYKYYYIIAIADTLLTVTGGSDYTVANAAITDVYYSHMANPVGFPLIFNYTPTLTPVGGGTYTSTRVLSSYFYIANKLMNYIISFDGSIAGTVSSITCTIPINFTVGLMRIPSVCGVKAGIGQLWSSYPTICEFSVIGANFDTGDYKGVSSTLTYKI